MRYRSRDKRETVGKRQKEKYREEETEREMGEETEGRYIQQ
jgi:hypothetical protein